MSKRRSYYGAGRIRYPASVKGCRYPQVVGYDTDKTEIVQLGNQKYRRERVRNKVHFVGMDSQGKPITIPYQTCTLVKVREEITNTGEKV